VQPINLKKRKNYEEEIVQYVNDPDFKILESEQPDKAFIYFYQSNPSNDVAVNR